jgi:hypothetical protein
MIVLAIKMAIIFSHPGFITGDDVEIQEMTIGRVVGASWPVWDLRSAVYPMTVVFPVQWIAHALGTTDIGTLVSAGRAAAATLSSALLAVLFVAVRRAVGMPAALLAVTLASTSHLLMAFGASELPRPVATVLVVAGFACVLGRTASTALAAGVLVGTAATLRFTEVLFIVPAVVQLALERRWQHAAMFIGGAITAAGMIQITGDLLFWGQPFHSLINIVDYTLVQRQSSRGFQPPWEYAWNVTSWTDPVIVVLAVIGTSKRTRAVALWAWIPVVMLSALPHKEARYLLPVVPFVVTLSGIALWERAQRVLVRAQSDRAVGARMALAVCLAIAASLTYEIGRFHVRRSDDAVRLARALANERGNGGLAVEQLWRMGGRLYLATFSPLIDVDSSVLTRGGAVAAAEDTSVQAIALRADTCARVDCVTLLAARGFAERTPPVRSDYRLFAREREGRQKFTSRRAG